MQFERLNLIRCPISKTALRFQLISEFEKSYKNEVITEINEGLLFSETGFVFPIIDGIPRLLIESFYDYSDFLKRYVKQYEEINLSIKEKHKGLIEYCINKNKKSKQTFEFEWSFLNPQKKDKIWNDDLENLSKVFLNEMGESPDYFNGKYIMDVGCGHGLMTTCIASLSKLAIGIELSRAIENAYKRNQNKNVFYMQADLQFLPFEDHSIDVIYSSGVIHHTNNTELSLSLIEAALKSKGKLCLWLYHSQESSIHKLFLWLRKFTKNIPLKISFMFIMIFIFPFSFIFKKLKNKKSNNYREEIIDLLDQFTPEFRYEIPHDIATHWLKRRQFKKIKITSLNQYGFSIVGEKST